MFWGQITCTATGPSAARFLTASISAWPGDGLVGDDQDVAWLLVAHSVCTGGGAPPPPAGAGCAGVGAFSLKTACTAPGTPYSYGPPTTVGTSSKLKIGGGEDTCHSIEWARHGLAAAFGPCRHEVIML